MTKTKSIIYCGLFTALIAVGAFIKIPVPVVPFTLQYLFTMLAGLLLGARRGSLSVFAYMVLGLAGLPIFTEGGGLWYVFKPSFGYIIGFCLGTYVTGRIAEHLKKKKIFRRYIVIWEKLSQDLTAGLSMSSLLMKMQRVTSERKRRRTERFITE